MYITSQPKSAVCLDSKFIASRPLGYMFTQILPHSVECKIGSAPIACHPASLSELFPQSQSLYSIVIVCQLTEHKINGIFKNSKNCGLLKSCLADSILHPIVPGGITGAKQKSAVQNSLLDRRSLYLRFLPEIGLLEF